MKKKILAVLLTAAFGLSGCAKTEDYSDKTVNVVDMGGSSGSASSSIPDVLYSSSSDMISSSQSSSSASSKVQSSSSSSSKEQSSSSSSSKEQSSSSSSSKVQSSSSSSSKVQSSSSSSSKVQSSSSSSSKVQSSSSSSSKVQSSSSSSSKVQSSSSTSSKVQSSSSTSSKAPVSSDTASSPVPNTPPDVPKNDYEPLNYDEIRGVWISYLELNSMSNSTESAFRKSISAVFDNCADLGINTVYVHARSHGDAFYSSSLFPRTKFIGGSYDALKIAVEEAHKRNLSIHAWINPLRACAKSDVSREKGYKIGEWIDGGTRAVLVNGYYYLNPAYDEVVQLIADGVTEIVSNYDVDGVHIDDYFYPTTAASFDAEAFKNSGYSSLSDFRFANCDKFVSSIYKAMKNVNQNLLFSVSCQGNINNNYVYMYADVKKWCSQKGYLDIIMPQVYFGFKHKTQPFEKCCKEWDAIARKGNVPLVIGVAASNIGLDAGGYAGAEGSEGRNEWINDKEILARQYISARELECYSGICLYSYNSLFKPQNAVKAQVEEEKEALKNAFAKNGDQ